MLKKNYFPTNLVYKCIKIFLNNQFSQKILEHTVRPPPPTPKKIIYSVTLVLHLGISSLCLRTHLQKSINSNISLCKTKIIFKSSTNITVKCAVILKLELVNTQVLYLYRTNDRNQKNEQTICWFATNHFLLTTLVSFENQRKSVNIS